MSSGRSHLFCFVFSLTCVIVFGNVLNTKELNEIPDAVPVPSEDETKISNEPKDVAEKVQVDEPVIPAIESDVKKPEKKCAEIGEFCVGHSDCCTFACLGYLKRCVSGSG